MPTVKKAAPVAAAKTAKPSNVEPTFASPLFKKPAKPAECADMLFTQRTERLKIQRQADAIEENEKLLKQFLIEALPRQKSTGVAGKLARISLKKKTVAVVKDWDKFYKYVVKEFAKNPGAFAVLNRAINQAAIDEIWKSGKTVPGVEPYELTTVSVEKLA